MFKFNLSDQWKAPYLGLLIDDEERLSIRAEASKHLISVGLYCVELNVFSKGYSTSLRAVINCTDQLKNLISQCDSAMKPERVIKDSGVYTTTMAHETKQRKA